MTHPYTDPVNAGLVQLTPSQRLMNADMLRQRRSPSGPGSVDDAVSPLGGLGDSLESVLYPAGYGRQPKQPVVNDADPPNQKIVSDGENLHHIRNMGDGTEVVTPMGPDSLQEPSS